MLTIMHNININGSIPVSRWINGNVSLDIELVRHFGVFIVL